MPEHYTTAYELALITDYALNNTKFAQIVNTKTYTVTINGYTKTLSNTNELLGNIEGVNGVKTGFTNGANRCLVSSVKRGDMNVITVVLGADTKKHRTTDSIKLIEYAYNNYEMVDIRNIVDNKFEDWKRNNEKEIIVNKAKEDNLEIYMEDIKQSKFPIRKNEKDNIEVEIEYIKYLESPLSKDQIIGEAKIMINNKEEVCLKLFIGKEVKKKNVFDYYISIIKNYNIYIESII